MFIIIINSHARAMPWRGLRVRRRPLCQSTISAPGWSRAREKRRLAYYRGKVLLIVNVASKCAFTPQYNGLQALYEQYQPRAFEILAFPCDQFGHQEPGSDAEIATFCNDTYGVTFPLFAKIEVTRQECSPALCLA